MTSLNLATVAVASTGLTTATTAYTAGDQVGAVFTFTLTNKTIILGGILSDKAAIVGAMTLWLFNSSPTPAADNAAFSISDADALNVIGTIEFPYPKTSSALNRTGSIDSLGATSGGSTTIYGLLVTESAHTFFGAAGDIQIRLNGTQDV